MANHYSNAERRRATMFYESDVPSPPSLIARVANLNVSSLRRRAAQFKFPVRVSTSVKNEKMGSQQSNALNNEVESTNIIERDEIPSSLPRAMKYSVSEVVEFPNTGAFLRASTCRKS